LVELRRGSNRPVPIVLKSRQGFRVTPAELTSLELTWRYVRKIVMRLTRKEVQQIAMLARLRLTPEEEERLTEQLDNILRYMGKLNQLDTSGIEPFGHTVEVINPMREDIVTNQANAEALLANAPAKENTFLQVPKIIE
jgi:aspartyl-tRNA(Asn)/glutamyl-tRNA(Gln) amidotransferase subunit C